jgi:hypothetical protein
MIYVPEKFQPKHPFRYPEDNFIEFERWYYENRDMGPEDRDMGPEDRQYLPILWTAYYCRHKFGQHKPAMVDLQKFLNGLDRSKKYYTIVQYDNGILSNLGDLDIMVFSMSGGRTDYPLPLISQPHQFSVNQYIERCFIANFVGAYTHPIRKQIINRLPFGSKYYLSTEKHSLSAYCAIIKSSTFTLCPRGFGPTSFRIQEALQYGSIPVYISDEFIIPHNTPFDEYGVLIEAKDAHRVHEILSAIPEEDIRRRQKAIPGIYHKYFTYEGNKEAIQKAVIECGHTAGAIPI